MFDVMKVVARLDNQDPRQNPIPAILSDDKRMATIKNRKMVVETILGCLDDDLDNRLRMKARGVLLVIDEEFEAFKEKLDQCNCNSASSVNPKFSMT